MRQLKFRAWDKKQKRIRQIIRMELPVGEIEDLSTISMDDNYLKWEYARDLIIMQYTGLKDKNGKEIYEGDFLEGRESGEFGSTLSTWVDVIVWDKKKASFVAMDIGEGEALGLDEVDSDKVIGNIHTHPEWLQRIRKEFDALRGDNR